MQIVFEYFLFFVACFWLSVAIFSLTLRSVAFRLAGAADPLRSGPRTLRLRRSGCLLVVSLQRGERMVYRTGAPASFWHALAFAFPAALVPVLL